ncbi:UrcA family protein [Aurantiacibacter gilvus]|uniref:UrcA family protein n=1 Tax=Aurantiacibacter gilvus TaxID=3139141 RepID=A0ABU9IE91_9SPHN
MTKFSIKSGLAAALTAGALFATPAIAAGAQGETVAVRYSDLDLSTEAGQRTLERRLTSAAEEVCGIDNRSGFALPSTEARRCYRETVQNFEREIAARAEQQQRG